MNSTQPLYFPKNFGIFSQLHGQDRLYDVVREIYASKGVLVEIRPEWRNVLAVRNFTPVTKDVPRGNFDDMMLVSWLTDGGVKRCQYFDANTDPSYQYNKEGTKDIRKKNKASEGLDADGDGDNDLGMLPTGVYKYSISLWTPGNTALGKVFKLEGSATVYRDINEDGVFDEKDEKLVKFKDRMNEGGTMYIHRAYNKAGKQTLNSWSAGCQTLEYSDFLEFQKSILAGRTAGQPKFSYVLIDKSEFHL